MWYGNQEVLLRGEYAVYRTVPTAKRFKIWYMKRRLPLQASDPCPVQANLEEEEEDEDSVMEGGDAPALASRPGTPLYGAKRGREDGE